MDLNDPNMFLDIFPSAAALSFVKSDIFCNYQWDIQTKINDRFHWHPRRSKSHKFSSILLNGLACLSNAVVSMASSLFLIFGSSKHISPSKRIVPRVSDMFETFFTFMFSKILNYLPSVTAN